MTVLTQDREALVWSVTHVTGLRVGGRTPQSNHRGGCSAFTLKIGIPVVRTPSSHCKGHELDPWSGDRSQSPHGVLHGQKNKILTLNCSIKLDSNDLLALGSKAEEQCPHIWCFWEVIKATENSQINSYHLGTRRDLGYYLGKIKWIASKCLAK